MNHNVCAIIITYNPEIEKFKNVIKSISGNNQTIVIVDNASMSQNSISNIANTYNAVFIPLPENEGIAYAQNVGITYALENEFHYVFLMDQDTIIPHEGIASLLKTHSELEQAGEKIGSIGYAYKNTHTQQLSPIWRCHKTRIKEEIINLNIKKIFEVDFTIASGSLIASTALRKIGLMDADLFIDSVDLEWGLRAQALGYKNFQSFEKIMEHSLGSRNKKLFHKYITIHPPIRNYYIIRNSIRLLRMNHVNKTWKKYLIKRIFLFFFVFGFCVDEHYKRIYLMTRGIWDGLLGRQGRIDRDMKQHKPIN